MAHLQSDLKGRAGAAVGFYNRCVLCYSTKEEQFFEGRKK